jgi:hypothetical protein
MIYIEFMTPHFPLLWVCTAIFLSLMLVLPSGVEEELPEFDVYVLGQHAYVAAGASGL